MIQRGAIGLAALLLLSTSGPQFIVRTPPAPTLISLSVTSGSVGTTVVLSGTGFQATQGSGSVVFLTTVATPTVWSDTSITVTVPIGAVTGDVHVNTVNGPSNRIAFTVAGGIPLDCATVSVKCVPSEFATIQAGMNAAVAGDVVWVSAGNYVETPSIANSGTSGNTITVLANGTVTTCGLTSSAKSYVRFVGLTFDRSLGGCAAGTAINATGTNTGLEFWNVAVSNPAGGKAYNIDIGAGSTNRCDKCIWLGGSVGNTGSVSSLVAMLISGDDMFVGYLNFTAICYVGIGPAGTRGRFIHNDFSGLIACGSSHPDNFYIATNATEGWTNSLVESVFDIGTPTSSDNKFHHQQNSNAPVWFDNVYRLNTSYNLGGGVMSLYNDPGAGGNLRTRTYHNTWVEPERAQSVTGCQTVGSGATTSLYEYNDIFYQCQSPGLSTNIEIWGFGSGTSTANLFADYNLSFNPSATDTFIAPWTTQTHPQSNVDPKFTNFGTQDFTLQVTSGARGVGGPLTTATSCSGTTLNVATNGGAFFFGDNSTNLPAYGGKLMPGDTLTLVSTPHTVVSVSGDAITLDASVTCSNGDAVYFGNTSTIDIGAYPYKAGGYTLSATKAQVGSTVTITPNDASLARFAVIYENGMPKCIASAANAWACTVGSGVVTATIYPRYASQTQSVVVP